MAQENDLIVARPVSVMKNTVELTLCNEVCLYSQRFLNLYTECIPVSTGRLNA
jgi:hypothetical protein